MINLAINKREESKALVAVRRLTRTATTVILVLYLIGAAGFVGYWLITRNQLNQTSLEMTKLDAQLASKAELEVTVRRLDSKAREINSYLNSRPDTGKMIDVLLGADVLVSGWTYDHAKDTQRISVSTAQSSGVSRLSQYLTRSYRNVNVSSLTYSKDNSWLGVIEITGGGI